MGGDKLGGDGPTIRDAGCALTSAAMVMAYYGVDTDPKRLNNAIGRAGYADQSVAFGEPDDLPVIGDWDGDCDDNIGLYRPGSTTGVFYLDIDNDGGSADIVTPEYGDLGDIPIAGDWDGDSDDNIGVYRPGTGEFFLDATVPEVSASKTIYVDDDFDDEPSEHKWDMIQEGVNDASDGDTVIVYAGVYVENVDVNKSITLRGESADVVTVRAENIGDHVLEVTADYVNISGFAVTGATGHEKLGVAGICLCSYVDHCNLLGNNASNNYCGIYLLFSSNNNMLQNNTASNNTCGICLFYSNSNILHDNTANSNNYGGIHLSDSSDNTLTNNNASNNWCGIDLRRLNNNNALINNTVSNNDIGISLWYSSNYNTLTNNTANSNSQYGTLLYDSSNNTLVNNTFIDDGLRVEAVHCRNTVENNTVNGKPLVYLENTSNFTIQTAGQVILVNCTNITVENLNLQNTSIGVQLMETDDCKIANNVVSNNDWGGIGLDYSNNNALANNTASDNVLGIWLRSSSSNTLQNNNATNNKYGIDLYDSNNNTLIGNTANSNNGYGISLDDSSNNTLRSNTMSGNTYNIDVGDGPSSYTQNIDTSNTVDGKPIYYWIDQQDKQVIGDAGFVGLVNCTNITVKDLTLTNNAYGVLFAYTENSRIENVTASNNMNDGIHLWCSSNNTLTGNSANSNNDYGICLLYSNNTTLTNNIVSFNYRGIHQSSSSNNTLSGNTANLNDYGIYMRCSSNHNTLQNNTASDNIISDDIVMGDEDFGFSNGNGIYLCDSSNNILQSNTANSNENCGIYMRCSSNNNTLQNNTASDNSIGIYLCDSSNSTIESNVFVNDGLLYIDEERPYRNTVENNTVNGKPLVYLEDTSDFVVQNAGQVILLNCTNITCGKFKSF
jgi:parallel beta-helix repeat protein